MRLFVALEIPRTVRDNLAILIDELRKIGPKARWLRPETIHVTLKFIGEAPSERLPEIRSTLANVRSGGAVELRFRGLGTFPNAKRPAVLWAGIEASPNLQELAADIESSLEPLGFPRERRAYVPHLTLARFQPPHIPEALRAAISERNDREFGAFETSQFALFESKLKSSGAEHTALASFLFAAAEA